MAGQHNPQGENNMSDNTTQNENTETTQPVETEVKQPVETEVKEDAAGQNEPDWKTEARKWEQRAKADYDAAKKWREYENSLKPEQERVKEELEQTRKEAEEAKIALLKYEIATSKNLTPEALKLLEGKTREELEEKADAILSLITVKPKIQPNPEQGKPVGNGNQISRELLSTMTPKEIMEAKADGRLDALLKG